MFPLDIWREIALYAPSWKIVLHLRLLCKLTNQAIGNLKEFWKRWKTNPTFNQILSFIQNRGKYNADMNKYVIWKFDNEFYEIRFTFIPGPEKRICKVNVVDPKTKTRLCITKQKEIMNFIHDLTRGTMVVFFSMLFDRTGTVYKTNSEKVFPKRFRYRIGFMEQPEFKYTYDRYINIFQYNKDSKFELDGIGLHNLYRYYIRHFLGTESSNKLSNRQIIKILIDALVNKNVTIDKLYHLAYLEKGI